MGYWCWCQRICFSLLSVLPLMKNEHHLFRCSQPWRVVFCYLRGPPSESSLARSIMIHSASSGLQGWRQVLCHPSAGLY
ncbi:hypothetical protein L208DRAFT_1414050 [Tricholoma matsutake]|nr:hypothetical protein L208DRAFT_1414050 [Tricholoma matsutake 945]